MLPPKMGLVNGRIQRIPQVTDMHDRMCKAEGYRLADTDFDRRFGDLVSAASPPGRTTRCAARAAATRSTKRRSKSVSASRCPSALHILSCMSDRLREALDAAVDETHLGRQNRRQRPPLGCQWVSGAWWPGRPR